MTGSDIRALRKRLGLTQQHFATYLGFSTSAVQKWERGADAKGIYNTVLWLLSDAVSTCGGDLVAKALRETSLDRRMMLDTLMRMGPSGLPIWQGRQPPVYPRPVFVDTHDKPKAED